MAHITTPEAEALLDKEIPVLNHGFVRLVDYMGSDARIVQSARVSYGAGTKTLREDKGLINYLLRHEHMSPFEQVVFTFHLKMPIFVARQLVRHRTARMNEISGRYSVMNEEFYVPEPGKVRFQSKSNRQGASGETVPPEMQQRVLDILKRSHGAAYESYQKMIEADIARELARVNLPLSLYTEMYWQMDLRNLLHFIRLRIDDHAQYEIRLYAEALSTAVRAVAPIVWEAFEEYVVRSVRLSATQAKKLGQVLAASHPELAKELGLPGE
ncbi:MAG: FAD-dependent thymidylate synthase [Myxococcales bacterium]|nr:MAG: FAD-dependent thymidylate synthase [Myxococcales bacterium]